MISSPKAAGTASDSGTTHSLGDQSSKVLKDVRELGSIAVDQLGDTVNRIKDQGQETLAHGREQVEKLQARINKYVATNPMKTVLMALGVGALIGMVLRRR